MVGELPEQVQEFSPDRPVYLFEPHGVQLLNPSNITPQTVGQKAYGLTCIPERWVPPFCIISHALAVQIAEGEASIDIVPMLEQIPWIQAAADAPGFMLRSSAVDETMDERGSLVSEELVNVADLSKILLDCVEATKKHGKTIHWILQNRIETKLRGHLSNERRVAHAKRDWVIEFEVLGPKSDARDPLRLAIRKWRDGVLKLPTVLECTSVISIDRVLRNPAQWAADRKIRLHFEWVWDGACVWLVQGDLCTDRKGTDPRTLLPKQVHKVQADNLRRFRIATASDFNTYCKLSNAQRYSKLGYELPAFYVLEDRDAIQELICGHPSQAIIDDLEALVSQPLVIRTDGKDLPPDKRQMLPRSDELRTVQAVINWFSKELPKELAALKGCQDQLVFICHHFVPAVASAWSMAEPGKRVVRIEALWGIPEGMYWYGHDTYEVDTGEVDLARAIANAGKFRYLRRERYKEWYVAPNTEGVWCAHRTNESFDWKATISDDGWLSEMAQTSRKIAEDLKYPINVMWFLGIHKDALKHTILPWYHERSELDRSALRVAPRFKRADSKAVELHTQSDWESLKDRTPPDLVNVKRITVSPRDPSLIRSKEFLDELAVFAKERNAVIELKGGVLSHVFYILQRAGCIVEMVDLFGAREENLVFKKVVRDKIPDSIAAKGELVTQLKINGENLVLALKTKLIEEAIEVMDAQSTDEMMEELADVLEVVHALSAHLKIGMKNIEEARKLKRQQRGGFDEGKVLVKTTAVSSLTASHEPSPYTPGLFEDDASYAEAGAVTLEPEITLHQDEREGPGGRERLLEIELPAVLAKPVTKHTEFHIVANTEQGVVEIPLVGEWSVARKQSDLKIRLTIRSLPVQVQGKLVLE